jgi:probable HAF family extracellular repeat protein
MRNKKFTIFERRRKMRTKKAIFCAILLIISITASSSCAYYEVIDLGPGYAHAINDSNQIVGDSSGACLFDSTGGGANIYLGPGIAYSINDNGQIVGNSNDHACLFDPTGGGANTDLGTLGGGLSCARSINNSGQIVGYAHNSSAEMRACIFYGSFNIDLGTLSLGIESSAFSINNNNQIVGMSDTDACIFDISGNGYNIALRGEDLSIAYSNNDSGQIVGQVIHHHPFAYPEATLFDPTGEGNNIYLGGLREERDGVAHHINEKGQIVGSAVVASGALHACLFDLTGQGNNIDLNYFVDPSSGWILECAYCINNNGWVVGSGINPAGEVHAFLMLPEPATIGLLVLGGLVLLRKRIA